MQISVAHALTWARRAADDRAVCVRGLELALALALALTGCGGAPNVSGTGASWPEADALFHQDPRWLGGDGAASVDLAGGRSLWIFGDSFVATSAANVRAESEMVRNTVALMDGADPSTATLRFAWRFDPDGSPAPFFADAGDEWHWPGAGVRLATGELLLFLAAVRATPGEGLGFTEAGFRAVLVADPTGGDLLDWSLQWIEPPPPAFDPEAMVGTAVVLDGEHVVALASGRGSAHVGWLARWPAADAAAGDLSAAEWWAGEAVGWVPQGELGSTPPEAVIDEAGAECSLHHDARLGRWVHVASRGFGATTIAVRTAERLTGPWSSAVDVFTPPESRGGVVEGVEPFVYAAKAHPELAGREPGALVVTYATNSFDFADLFTPQGAASLYWPRVVEVTLEP
jgi:hypothetical protein